MPEDSPDHSHLTLKLVAAVEAGDAPLHLILEAAVASCEHCREVLQYYLDQCADTVSRYDGTFCRTLLKTTLRAELVQREAIQAEERFAALAGLPPEARFEYFRHQETAAGYAFIERLLGAVRACLPQDPAGALAWSRFTLSVLELEADPSPDHQLLALAHQANALRISDDFSGSARTFAAVRRQLKQSAPRDLETLAELDSLEASLRIDQRRFEAAQQLLTRALDLYLELGQTSLAARTHIQVGHLFRTAELPQVAGEAFRSALGLLSPYTEPRLYLAARFNLAHSLQACGEAAAAREVLAYDEELYTQHFEGSSLLRFYWLQARTAIDSGALEQAEDLLRKAHRGFQKLKTPFSAALVSLDLALLYLNTQRPQRAIETLASTVEIFSALSVHREALAALITLRDALRQQTATAETIRRVAEFLRRAETRVDASAAGPS